MRRLSVLLVLLPTAALAAICTIAYAQSGHFAISATVASQNTLPIGIP